MIARTGSRCGDNAFRGRRRASAEARRVERGAARGALHHLHRRLRDAARPYRLPHEDLLRRECATTMRRFLLTTYRGRDKNTHPRSSRGVSGDVSQRRSEAWRPVGRGVTAPREAPGQRPLGWERGPGAQIATVERREASVPSSERERSAPRKRRRAGHHGTSSTPQRLSALHPPLVGVGRARTTRTPGADAPR